MEAPYSADSDLMHFKTHDWILLSLLIALCGFGLLSYFWVPKDPETAKNIVQYLVRGSEMVLSFKFGIHQAQSVRTAQVSVDAPVSKVDLGDPAVRGTKEKEETSNGD